MLSRNSTQRMRCKPGGAGTPWRVRVLFLAPCAAVLALAACGGRQEQPTATGTVQLEITAPTRWVAAQIEFRGDGTTAPAVVDFSAGTPGLSQTGRPAADSCGSGCTASALLLSVAGDGVLTLRSAPTAAGVAVAGVRCVDAQGQDVVCRASWVR